MVSTFSLLGAAALLISDPGSADAPRLDAAATPARGELVAAPGAAQSDSVDAPSEELDPELAAIFEALSPSAQARLEALGPQGPDALFAKLEKGEALTEDETAILGAFQSAAVLAFEKELNYQNGDINLRDGLAVLHLGEDFRYLGPADTKRILTEAWGNPGDFESLGMIVPADISPIDETQGYGVLLSYSEEGHVDDDDADDIDYDELLEQMQEGTNAANAERTAAGYPALTLVGWAEAPHYDKSKRSLYWARNLSSEGADQNSLNYEIRVLGRKGVLELNAVAGMTQLAQIKPAMEDVYQRVEFQKGHRYGDFDPELDKVATYGLGGLIAGKLAMKAGIFAGLIKILIASKKLIIIGLIAIAAFFKSWFGRKEDAELPSDEDEATRPPQE